MLISEKGDYTLLKIKGVATYEQLIQAWENIVKLNEKANNNFTFYNFLELNQSYLELIREHQFVKLCLLRLYLKYDQALVEELRSMGYSIEDNKDPVAFFNSLSNCLENSNNLITQIQLKQKEMQLLTEENKGNRATFEDILAETGYQIGFALKEDITLAQFNGYRKIINKKNSGKKNRETRPD